MTPELQTLIDDAYRIFADYRIGSTLRVCRCNVCMSEAHERQLVKTPLRAIPSSLLAEYTNSAHGWDDDQIAHEMRHFLPRYLELIALHDPPDHFGIEICLRRLGESGWRAKWPPDESALLDRYFDALLRASLLRLDVRDSNRGPQLRFDLADVLTMLVTAGVDIERVLAAWDAAADPPAALHMAALRQQVRRKAGRTYLDNAHLDNHAAAADRIGAFLVSPETDARIEAAFFTVDEPLLQSVLSNSL
jgi:hypothetical protein